MCGVLEQVTVTRYATPLREGGSPAIVEADNLGTYVMKFRGAGQGPKALAAEIICGELARALGLPTPEFALGYLDPRIPGSEPDPRSRICSAPAAGSTWPSTSCPGRPGLTRAGWTVDPDFASRVLWFDALVQNVDRTWRNPNLLVWHGDIWLIDHGAALYFHHNWPTAQPGPSRRHGPCAARGGHAASGRARGAGPDDHRGICSWRSSSLVPGDWLGDGQPDGYVESCWTAPRRCPR